MVSEWSVQGNEKDRQATTPKKRRDQFWSSGLTVFDLYDSYNEWWSQLYYPYHPKINS